MAVSYERGSHHRDRPQLGQVRQCVVKNGEVDIQATVRDGGNAVVESAFEIDNGVDLVLRVYLTFVLKYSIVLPSPSSRGTFGSQFSSARARVISG